MQYQQQISKESFFAYDEQCPFHFRSGTSLNLPVYKRIFFLNYKTHGRKKKKKRDWQDQDGMTRGKKINTKDVN